MDYTKEEIEEAFEALAREGLIINTKRVRGGRPVYVAVENATAEELKAAREDKN